MATLSEAGIDDVILFPMAGSQTQSTWTASAQSHGLGVIVGGHMTHPGYLASHGGYISDGAIELIYRHAAGAGVTDFVVPGNKPDVIRTIRALIEDIGVDPIFYAPGFLAQRGEISEAAREAGARWHAIVGRGFFQDGSDAQSIRSAALRLVASL